MSDIRRTRAMKIDGKNTNLSLEPDFWHALGEIARELGVSRVTIVGDVARKKIAPNLSSAVRVFVLEYFRARLCCPVQNCGARDDEAQENLSVTADHLGRPLHYR